MKTLVLFVLAWMIWASWPGDPEPDLAQKDEASREVAGQAAR